MTDFDPAEGNEDPTWIDSEALRGFSRNAAAGDASDPQPPTVDDIAADESTERLGDFELLREIGRDTGDEALSSSACETIVGLRPRDPKEWIDRGWDLDFDCGWEQALLDLSRAIELAPTYKSSYDHRANVTHSYALRAIGLPYLGRCDEALNDIARSKELATTGHADDYATVYVNLALAHLSSLYYHCPAQFDAENALEFAQAARQSLRERTQSILGYALYRNGRYSEANRALQAAFDEKNEQGVWFTYAMCLWQLGEQGRARELYDRSIRWMDEHEPNPPPSAPQRREAAELMGIAGAG